MTSYLLDTHVWDWAIKLDDSLPSHIAEILIASDMNHVSPVTFYEIAQKVRIGKWPEMAAFSDRLEDILHDQGGVIAVLSGSIAQNAGLLDWDHRDPFDRIIASTAIVMKLPLMSADPAFDALSHRADWPGRVW